MPCVESPKCWEWLPNDVPQTFTSWLQLAAQREFSFHREPGHWGLRGSIMQKTHELMDSAPVSQL
jgi:hypothetical protein